MYKEDKQRKIQVSKYIQYVKKDIYIYIYIYIGVAFFATRPGCVLKCISF